MCKTLLKAVLKVLAVLILAFVGTFTVYMFNLDMKLMAFLEPYLSKVYDLRKDRNRKI